MDTFTSRTPRPVSDATPLNVIGDEPTWNPAAGPVIEPAGGAAFCTVQFVRERRIHEEILRNVLASVPEDD